MAPIDDEICTVGVYVGNESKGCECNILLGINKGRSRPWFVEVASLVFTPSFGDEWPQSFETDETSIL